MARLARTRGVTLYVILALAAPVIVGVAAHRAAESSGAPNIGVRPLPWLAVGSHDSRWQSFEPIEPTDRIVAFADQWIVDRAHLWRLQTQLEPGELTVYLQRGIRDGVSQIPVTLTATELTGEDLAGIWIQILIGASLIVTGLVVFLLRPGRQASWLFVLFGWSLGLWFLYPWLSEGNTLPFRRMQELVIVATIGLGVHLFMVFPRRIRWLDEHRHRAIAFYLVPALAAVPFFVTFPSREHEGVWLGCDAVLRLGIVATALWASIATIASRHRALAIATIGGFLAPFLTNALLVAYNLWPDYPWLRDVCMAPTLAFGGMAAALIVRQTPVDGN